MLIDDYADENYDWSRNLTMVQPRSDLVDYFKEMGFSVEIANSLIASGFVANEYSPVIIDRYHGGCLSSCDERTRFSPANFSSTISKQEHMASPFPVHHAKSESEMRRCVDAIQKKLPTKKLNFRGQTSHYTLNRKIKNPMLNHPTLGETSLVPSVWRYMLNSDPQAFPEFSGIPPMSWGSILYKLWPMDEIRSREAELAKKGEFLHTISDMEDCSDELLRAFGKFRGDLHIDEALFQTGLVTMMQHYGLPSPFLDLTTDLDVALFFATHRYCSIGDTADYAFVGANYGKSIIYIVNSCPGDMHSHERNRVMEVAKPERPRRQSCVVCSTNAWSINLPADYIVGAVFLDYEITNVGRFEKSDLFPDPSQDAFLGAWMSTGEYPITVF